MSRMTTSLASFSWASAAIRRACSMDVKRLQCSRGRRVEAARARSGPPTAAGTSSCRRPRRGRAARAARSRRSGTGSISKKRTRSGCSSLREHRVEPLAREAGPRRDAEPHAAAAPPRAPSSPGSRRTRRRRAGTRPRPTPGWRAAVSIVRACSSSTTSSSGNAARASASRTSAGVVDVLVARGRPRRARPAASSPSSAFALPRRARRARCAAGRTRRRRARSRVSELERLVADLDRRAAPCAPASRSARSSSSSDGGVPTTRKPSSVRKRRHGRAFGCGPVDEEVGERVLAAASTTSGSGTSVKSAARKLVDPLARRAREREARRRSARRRSSNSGSGSRSILFRTTICGSSSRPAPYAASSASIVAPLLVGRLRGVDHVHEAPRALEVREELVAEADALARALDQPGHVGDDELAAVGRLDRAEHRLRAS